jgi:hypothetical protein
MDEARGRATAGWRFSRLAPQPAIVTQPHTPCRTTNWTSRKLVVASEPRNRYVRCDDREDDMGLLIYAHRSYEIPDRTLLHLQITISTKLRRHERFGLSWTVPAQMGSGRHTVWIDNGVPMRFIYDDYRMKKVNPKWIDAMLQGANSPSGLSVMDEPAPLHIRDTV